MPGEDLVTGAGSFATTGFKLFVLSLNNGKLAYGTNNISTAKNFWKG
jgi:hypothetical protein